MHMRAAYAMTGKTPSVDAGAREDETATVAPLLPSMKEHERLNYIRLCKRLENGGDLRNTRSMMTALRLMRIENEGLESMRARIELRLRAVEFEKDEDFKPLASQIELSETEFNDLVNEGELDFVHKIADVVAVLEQLPPPLLPLPPVPPPQPPPPPPLPLAEYHNPGAAGAAAHGPEGQGVSPAPLALAAVPP